jgi:hypothetical protein
VSRERPPTDAVTIIVWGVGASDDELQASLESIRTQTQPADVIVLGSSALVDHVAGSPREFVGLLAAGDLFLPGALTLAVEALVGAPLVATVSATVLTVGGDGRLVDPPPGFEPRPLSGVVGRTTRLAAAGDTALEDIHLRDLGPAVGVDVPLVAQRLHPQPDAPPGPLQRVRARVRAAISRPPVDDTPPPPTTGWEYAGTGDYDATVPLPPGAADELVDSNARLRELRTRYADFDSPLCVPTFWGEEYRARDLDLRYFRGDNAFLWQYRNMRTQTEERYALYLRHLLADDRHGCFDRTSEDGAFGCWTFSVPGQPLASRDLLDSVNEISFLDRVWGVVERSAFTVLDIGAGYGRLAHRLSAIAPGLTRYYCTDGIAESTFLCEYYLGFRGVENAEVVPADELGRLRTDTIDLAVNIHSFSEMGLETVTAWFELLTRLRVPRLLIVPNDPDELLTYEADHTRSDFAPVIAAAGYELAHCEPTIAVPHVRALIGARDNFYWFVRRDVSG